MTQVLKPCPRQERQGRLRKASDGVEGQRKARKDRAPREVSEGSEWRGAGGPHRKPTQDAEDPEYQEGADHEEAPRRVQDTGADPG